MQQAIRRTAPVEQGNAIADAVLAHLKRTPEGATLNEIVDALDERIADTGNAIKRLRDLGLVSASRHPYKPAVYTANAVQKVTA